MTRIKCLECGTESDSLKSFGYCENCAGLLPASSHFSTSPDKVGGRRNDYEPFDYIDVKEPSSLITAQVRSARLQTASTLFGVAMIQMFCSFASIVFFDSDYEDNHRKELLHFVVLSQMVGIVVIFAGLATWAMFQPLIPAIIGLLLYLLYVSLFIKVLAGEPLKLLVEVLLVIALGRAFYGSMKATIASNSL